MLRWSIMMISDALPVGKGLDDLLEITHMFWWYRGHVELYGTIEYKPFLPNLTIWSGPYITATLYTIFHAMPRATMI